MKKILSACCLLLIIALLSTVLYTKLSSKPSDVSAVLIGGAFTLQDTEGVTVHDTDFRGRLMLVYFGFTYCPDVCPMGLQTISVALESLGKQQADIQALFITIDPERDSAKQMKSYMTNFNSNIKALTGSIKQVEQATASYRVYSNKVHEEKNAGYLIDHSAFIYLMDREGHYLTHFPPNATAEQIAVTIRKYL